MMRAIDSPSPVPLGLVVKKGRKISASFPSGIPKPESETDTSAAPFPTKAVWTVTVGESVRPLCVASIALCVATTILLKMHGAKYMWITCAPMVWLVSATFTAAWQKIFSPLPAIGFLAQAEKLEAALQAGSAADVAATQTLIFNARLDAAICGIFMVLVSVILLDSIRVWAGILSGNGDRRVHEAPFVVTRLQAEEL